MTNDLISRKTAQILIEKKCVEFSLKKKFKLTSENLAWFIAIAEKLFLILKKETF